VKPNRDGRLKYYLAWKKAIGVPSTRSMFCCGKIVENARNNKYLAKAV
jgi:hypothetical protein